MNKIIIALTITVLMSCLVSPVLAGEKYRVTPEQYNSEPTGYPIVVEMPDEKYFGNFHATNDKYGYWLGMKNGKLALFFTSKHGTKWCREDWKIYKDKFTSKKGSKVSFKGPDKSSFSFKRKLISNLKRVE